jgi:hypothetical protein
VLYDCFDFIRDALAGGGKAVTPGCPLGHTDTHSRVSDWLLTWITLAVIKWCFDCNITL